MRGRNYGRRGLRHASLLFATAALALAVFASTASADTPPPIPANADWKTTVNFYRAMAGLPALIGHVDEAAWSDGGFKHSRYMVENNVITHEETPGPWYTPEGDAAGRNGNVHLRFASPTVNCAQRLSVESWIEGPFHAVGIVDPKLQKSGFGSYVNSAVTSCGATLDVHRGFSGSAATGPVFFPGNGTTTPLLSYTGGEQTDPLSHSGCSGFSTPTGPAILLQLQTTPGASTVTLKDNDVVVPSCSFDENTYNGTFGTGRDVLASGMRSRSCRAPRGGTTTGHAYSWLDARAPRGSTTLRYRLQAVSLDGTRRWAGTASVGR